MSSKSNKEPDQWTFGSRIPYAENSWAAGAPSPYYNDSHRRLRKALRTWMENKIIPHVSEWEVTANIPDSVYQEAARAGILLPTASGKSIDPTLAKRYPIIGNIDPGEWDGFHDFILHDEFGRVGGIGLENGLLGGATLCTPAIMKFGSKSLKDAILDDVLSGKARLALAITEPEAGSDVRGLQTEAVVCPDGKAFIVNGQKKWITGGMYATYFLTLVKEVSGSFTLIVAKRSKGLSTRHMVMSGSNSAGTAFVDFDDVYVPLDMVVGERGQGLKYIMSNFNHERLFIAMQSMRCSRVCLEDSISFALTRETFGKRLIDHPVIRYKVANMSRQVEALGAWLESLIFQLQNLSPTEADFLLAGTTAQIKAHSGIVLELVVRDAVQMMGGLGLTRGGRGERVERIWRDVKAITVPGGSEEIMLDLSARRAIKIYEEIQKSAAKL
ncbi:acyl-CoA dehydrogenase [Boeremia exigua]|uniref:acyl-CoA dehydrogenase n=1 Tax=Boeremia exigua TaxID=749465 RepID=UPI001E8D39D2|nr:acyl-CoA dehydrogenase [Boeremia exigua]KAH6642758.1 acyl-CoA dehydrogenase [Boeremia exigua]